MKRISLIVCLLLALSLQAGAQEVYNSSGSRWARPTQKKGGFDPQKLILGGGLWLGFGAVTSVYVAPIAGYRFSERFAAGLGLSYQYYHANNYYMVTNLNTGLDEFFDLNASFLAPSIWGRALIIPNLFAQVEFQQNFISQSYPKFDPNGSGNTVNDKMKYQFPSLFVGGGYRQPMSENSSMYFMVLYDVIQDNNPFNPYLNTVDMRIGFNLGF